MRKIQPNIRLVLVAALAALLALTPGTASAVKVADLTRLVGHRTNVLTGLGLVVGLKGTGDGGQYLPAIRPLAAMLTKQNDPTTVAELGNASNIALVSIIATVPANGVRDGDKVDVKVMSLGAASSLRGGRLYVTPLTGPVANSGIFALAEGAVVVEDPLTPTVGVIKGGAVMEADIPAKNIDEQGRLCLVIEEPSASWTMASTIAKIINESEAPNGETIAVAADPKNVFVTIPVLERQLPDSFISRIQRLPVPILPTEARVQINERTGTMIITGDVEISPVVIAHQGLSISTVQPAVPPTPRNPQVSTKEFVGIDPQQQGGAKLQDLLAALDQIKVPAADRITIVKEIHKSGKLHAKLILE